MSINRLNDLTIKSAIKKGEPSTLWDGEGLHLVVATKLWRLQYRFNGRGRLASFGKYPRVSLEKARQLKEKAKNNIADGIDPIEHKRQNKVDSQWAEKYLFCSVAEIWFNHWKVDKADKTVEQVWRRLEVYVLPKLVKKDIRFLKDQDFINVLNDIDNNKIRVKHKIYQNCKQIMEFACSPLNRTIKTNPMASFKAKDVLIIYPHSHHSCIKHSELPQFLADIAAYPDELVRCAVRLLMLTWVRTMELIDAKWSEVDFQLKHWKIPPERAKPKTEHIVPLSSQIITEFQIIKSLAEGDQHWKKTWRDSGRIFPWVTDNRRNKILNTLYEMGYKGKMTGHGFRTLASTTMHELDYAHEHIEMQLAHKERNRSSAAYNSAQYLKQRAEMMQAWGDYLGALT